MKIERRVVEAKLRASLLPTSSEAHEESMSALEDALAMVNGYALEQLERRHRGVSRATSERWLDEVRDLERTEEFLLQRGDISPVTMRIAAWIGRYFGCAVGSMNDYSSITEERLSTGRILVFGRFHRALALEVVFSAALRVISEQSALLAPRVGERFQGSWNPFGADETLEDRLLRVVAARLDRARERINVGKRVAALSARQAFDPGAADGFGIEGDLNLAAEFARARALDVEADYYLLGWKDFISVPIDRDLLSIVEVRG